LYNDWIWETIGATKIPLGGGFHGGIFDHITSLENLFRAWKEFKKNKSKKPDVITFSLNLENNIFKLRDELVAGSWVCGGYKKFSIKDPKPRTIHKATVGDRVLYQAIYRILYPIFDKTFIFDSYSSRVGKGTHAGIKRLNASLQKLSRNYTKPVYALKCDIKKFFDSIDHHILLMLIKQKIDCPETMELLEKIVDSFHKTLGKGLPLGNVTSQVFANVYMNPFDWFVKKQLGEKSYIRYCDDFIILSNSRAQLSLLVSRLQVFLMDQLKLEMHPDKVIIRSLNSGIDFLGAVLLPYRMVPRTKTMNRIIKKSKKLFEQVKTGKLMTQRLKQSLSSYFGHLSHTKSYKAQSFLRLINTKIRDLP